MKVKTVVASMFVLGLLGGTAIGAQQRGDIAGLRARLNEGSHQVYTKGGSNWFTQHVTVNGQIRVDAGISDETRADPITGRLGVSGIWLNPAIFVGNPGNRSSSDLNLRNSNISVDIQPASWVNGHIEIVAQSSRSVNQAVLTLANRISFVSLDEAYATLGELSQSPFFFSAGRMYVPFGNYKDPHPLTYSLPQELSEINAVAANLGYVQPCGFWGSVYAFRGDLLRAPTLNGAGFVTNNHANINNGGVDVGYDWGDGSGQTGFMLGGSWVFNMLDARAIYPRVTINNAAAFQYNTSAGGVALHADGYWNNFDADVTWVTAVRRFSVIDATFNGVGAKPSSLGVHVGYGFMAMGHENRVSAGYEQTSQSLAFFLPKRRWIADWTMGLAKNTNLQFEYTHDRDYSAGSNTTVLGAVIPGSGRNANTGKVRLSVGFL